MKGTAGVPDLSDKALENHIQDLQSKINSLHISLDLATAERHQRSSHTTTPPSKPIGSDSSKSSKSSKLTIGSRVKILNKYRGNKDKIGKIVHISGKTATVHIPQTGNFIKYLSNLELVPSSDEE